MEHQQGAQPATAGLRSVPVRVLRAWGKLDGERRLAAIAALAMFVTMLLPWYSKTETIVVHNAASSTEQSLSAFQAFSWVEAAVLLVAAGVLLLLFERAERRPFHLPGSDGTVIMAAGGWSAILIFYRLLDKPGLQGNAKISSTVGVQWGIFLALLAAILLAYAGTRLRAGRTSEPPLERRRPSPPPAHAEEEVTVAITTSDVGTASRAPASARPRYPQAPPPAPPSRRDPPEETPEQLSFEDHPGGRPPG
ncbi:MAG: hypothetical protein ACRDK2_04080 [Solirubrobacteraceae bacterium]